MRPGQLYVNVGFWGTVPLPPGAADGLLQPADRGRRSTELGGHKSLYSTSFYSREEFWRALQRAGLRRAQERLRPGGRLPDLYEQVRSRGSDGGDGTMALGARCSSRSRARTPRSSSRPTTGAAPAPQARPVRITVSSPAPSPTWRRRPGALGLARAYVTGDLDVDGDMYAALARMAKRAADATSTLAERLAAAARARRADGAAAAGRRRRRRRSASRRWLTGAAALQGATRARSRTTTTCPTRSTSGCSARRWPTPARATRPRTPRWRRRRTTSSTWSRASSALRAGHAAARRRLRLGRHGHARRPRVRRAGARRHAVRSSRPSGRRRRSARRALATWPRSATWTTATSPRPASTRSARSG